MCKGCRQGWKYVDLKNLSIIDDPEIWAVIANNNNPLSAGSDIESGFINKSGVCDLHLNVLGFVSLLNLHNEGASKGASLDFPE